MTDRPADPPPASNLAEYTVGEVAQAVKRTLEGAFGHVRVRGEVGRPNYHSSGHLYFTLKDESAALDAVCWRSTASRLTLRLEEGMEVVCTGRVSSYPRSSRYQIVVDAVEPAGEGALLKLLQERRRRLEAEGLFDSARKKRLPFLPEVIGIVTSPTGAVIRDILHRLDDRFPRRVLLWPVPVQGDRAAESVAAAIEGFDRLAPGGAPPRPDVVIVARGGGSLEDLWAFNDEIVARAAAASRIPIVSAIGHETDTTLIDHAADMRAPTPTAAAELAVPVRAELLARVLDGERRMMAGAGRLLAERATRLDGLGRGLPEPRRLLEQADQSLDSEVDRLRVAVRSFFQSRSGLIERRGAGLRHPRELLALAQTGIEQLRIRLIQALGASIRARRGQLDALDAVGRLRSGMARAVRDTENRLRGAEKLLDSLSYERVLERGYAVVRDRAGAPMTRAAAAPPGAGVTIQFSDGARGAKLDAGGDAKRAPAGDPQERLL